MNLFRKAAAYKWFPDADSVGGPEGYLLRADNTVPDSKGARTLRAGSDTIYSGIQDHRVKSIHTTALEGVPWQLLGAGDRLYANGAVLGDFEADALDGDIAFGDDAYQIFAARKSTRKKWDGVNFNNWGIPAPVVAPTLQASTLSTIQPATFDVAESPAFVINEGAPPLSATFVTGQSGAANGAIQLTPNLGTGRSSASKKFGSDQDYFKIGSLDGGGTDLFDCRVWFENWRKVTKVTFMFGLGTGTDPYVDDYYYYDFNINNPDTVDIKDAASQAASAFKLASTKALATLTPRQVTSIKSPAEAGAILRRLGRFAGPRSTERRDAQEASPAWGHLSVTRGQFNRVGGTSGRNWTTVRGFKVVYTTVPGSTEVAYFDDAIWTGGGALALTGTFTVGFRYARKFTLSDSTEVYYELSPMSPISTEVTLNQQALSVTIPAVALSGKDPQVGEIWAYIQGGWLDTYYRFAILPATIRSGMTIDELTAPVGSDFNTPEKRSRLVNWGFTHAQGEGAGSVDLLFVSGLSELEILIDNEAYTPGIMPVPEDIVAIAGPWMGRMFVLDKDGWLYPSGTSPSQFSAFHAIDLRRYGTPLWLAKTSGGIKAGFTGDVIQIAGDGTEEPDHVVVNLWGEPLNIGNPPVDKSVMVDGNTIIYRSIDGFMVLSGNSLAPLPFEGTSLMWRGKDRYGVEAVNLSGRFRLATDNHLIYALMSEGTVSDPSSVWRYDPSSHEWSRATYPFTPLSILKEPSGRLVVGANDGSVHEIEVGTQDDNVDVPINILTSIDDGGQPLNRKDPEGIQIHVDTGGNTGTVSFAKDGGILGDSLTFSTAGPRVYRSDLTTLGVFAKAQLNITGSFFQFALFGFNIEYRPRPQQMMVLDPGYVVPVNNGDMAWLTEAEIDCISPADLSLLIYKDDVLFRTLSVPVHANVRSVYRIPLPQGTKSRRLRLVTKTTSPAGQGDIGFEPYDFRVRHRGSGNITSLMAIRGDSP